ncbi:hypothetical protein GCM10027589_06450 [Actinocorallia lasiicapitis]
MDEQMDQCVEIPERLLSPTRYIERNLAIMILSCEFADAEMITLVCDFVSECERYSAWFVRNVKLSGRGLGEVLRLTEVAESRALDIYGRWVALEEGVERRISADDLDDLREMVTRSLQAAIDKLVATRAT